MSKYITNGNLVNVLEDGAVDIKDKLPAGIYNLIFIPMRGPCLEKISDFSNNDRVYGDFEDRTNRIIKTFIERESSTGVLMSGIKGSGKTMQSRVIAETLARDYDIPTVLITSKQDPADITSFLSTISEPICILFDEFEKAFDKKEQAGFLTMLDGVYTSKKLFLFTCNSIYLLNSFLLNRPGRIFYHFKFSGVPRTIVEEYCDTALINKNYLDDIFKVQTIFGDTFTFDILKCFVDETNRFNESPIKFIDILNVELTISESRFKISSINFIDPELNAKYYCTPTNANRGYNINDIVADNDCLSVCFHINDKETGEYCEFKFNEDASPPILYDNSDDDDLTPYNEIYISRDAIENISAEKVLFHARGVAFLLELSKEKTLFEKAF